MYGYVRNTTPFLNEWAEDALIFEDAQVPSVGTPASFTGIFSGQHATGMQTRTDPGHWKASNEGRTLLPELLKAEGYYTGAFHSNALMSRYFGWNRGWDVYEDHLWTEKGDDDGVEGGWKKTVYDLLQRADMANFAVHLKQMVQGKPPATWESMWDDIEEFVEDAPEPWFLWVLLIDTHHPYYPPEEYQQWPQPGIRATYAWNYVMRRYSRIAGERRRSIVNAYDNTLYYADQFLRQIHETLAANGHGNVPFIFHSDHGDELGEHIPEPYGHKLLMYDTVTRVPLIMKNVGETGRVDGPTTLKDLGSTVLDVAGSDERLGDRPSLLGDERVDRESVIVENRVGESARYATVVGPEWKVLYHPEDDWEAYHRPSDPFEQRNRWGEHPEELETRLREHLETPYDELATGSEELTAETVERLTELGYID
jgi:arylsulfatase